MTYFLYTVRDAHIGYGAIMMQPNDAAAMRAFAHECGNKDSYWNSHPNDFSIWRVGQFDTTTGNVIDDVPEMIANATDFVGKE